MYGPGPVTQGPKPAHPTTAVVLRVILTVLPVVTLGFLAWCSMLYLAVLRKRTSDWLMLAVAVGMAVIAVVCFGLSDDDNDWQANTGGTLILICMFGGAVYFLVADILRYRTGRQGWPAAPGYPQPNPYATGYGTGGPMVPPPHQGYPAPRQYPGPAAQPAPMQGAPNIPSMPSVPNAPVNQGPSTPSTPSPSRPATPPPVNRPATPTPVPRPTPPPAPRIDQVRAELDELSDFLRKERGDSQDSGEGEGAR
ncbi:hypothetical protein [Streptomyces sp. NBC_00448]|uniref:hypothetical protein n=1 Tax=Streptomyces sp. NBC_00448 TaxID=2903652 RepID=UPI002E21A21C